MRRKPGNTRLGLITIALAVFLALALAEILLTVLDLPPSEATIDKPPQFTALDNNHPWADIGHLNLIRDTAVFRYASNERGYFRFENEVDHTFNSLGFRGPEFAKDKQPNTLRIAFFGDSFTMGEGVYFEDTFAQQTRIQLFRRYGRYAEALNFGVSAFNTEQEAKLVRHVLPIFAPDALVLGYFMNDPAKRIPTTREAADEMSDEAALWDPVAAFRARNPPPSLRLLRLGYSALMRWKFRDLTLTSFSYLHDPNKDRWPVTAAALADIGDQCRQNRIPCIAVLFPMLWELQDYPLAAEHRLIRTTLEANGFLVLDLLEELQAYDAGDLHVHPTDWHPNETVHRLVGEKLAELIYALNLPGE